MKSSIHHFTFCPKDRDEKDCTFLGTTAYVPPEVLNSSTAAIGNDLWALGCTLFQMLSGTSPFKDASEYLIFQRIISPDYFSNYARDLIDKLLVSHKQIYNVCLYFSCVIILSSMSSTSFLYLSCVIN
ncbi:hypothetical protein R6Q57_008620 [Mikania cordata]